MMHYMFVFLYCIYHFQVVFHEIEFRRTFELHYAYINITFCLQGVPNLRTYITNASYVNSGTSFINMGKNILPCKMIVFLIIGSV